MAFEGASGTAESADSPALKRDFSYSAPGFKAPLNDVAAPLPATETIHAREQQVDPQWTGVPRGEQVHRSAVGVWGPTRSG